MKFSQRDLDILSAISIHGSATIARLAKTAGAKEHSVRRFLEGMIDRGILRPFTFINLHPAGYLEFSCHFSLSIRSEAERQKAIKAILSGSSTAWLSEYVGDYQYGMGLFAQSVSEALHLLAQMSARSGATFSRLSFSQVVQQKYYPLKYFNRSRQPSLMVKIDQSPKTIEIDQVDKKLLSLLGKNYGATLSALARTLNIPESTVSYRVKRMRDEGMLLGASFLPVHVNLGRVMYRLIIWTRDFNEEIFRRLDQFALHEPLVTFFVRSFGGWNYEMNVVAETPEEMANLMHRLHAAAGENLSEVKVLTSVRTHRMRMFPF